MRIAVISDVHGNLAALKTVLADVEARGVDLIVNLGDALSGPLEPDGVADLLMETNVVSIGGNHDRYLVEAEANAITPEGPSDAFAFERLQPHHRTWLQNLPATENVDEGRVLLCHGSPKSDLTYLLEEVGPQGIMLAREEYIAAQIDSSCNYEVILCGHTHLPRAVTLRSGMLVVNPGSVGMQAYGGLAPFSHKVETGSPHARYAWIERMRAGWRVNHMCVGYDWDTTSRLAQRNGREDWARRLVTGRA